MDIVKDSLSHLIGSDDIRKGAALHGVDDMARNYLKEVYLAFCTLVLVEWGFVVLGTPTVPVHATTSSPPGTGSLSSGAICMRHVNNQRTRLTLVFSPASTLGKQPKGQPYICFWGKRSEASLYRNE